MVIPGELATNDVVLKPTSSVQDLRAAAKFLGISPAGRKKRMYERICACHILALRRRSLEVAEQESHKGEIEPKESYAPTRHSPFEKGGS